MVARIPYGMAKQIVATLRVGDMCTVRSCWVISFHNAARGLGMKLAAVPIHGSNPAKYRMMRVDGLGITGRLAAAVPRRDRANGRWQRKVAA